MFISSHYYLKHLFLLYNNKNKNFDNFFGLFTYTQNLNN